MFRLKLCLPGSSTSFFGTHKCISLNVANSGPTIVHSSVSWLNKLLQLKYAFSFKLKKKFYGLFLWMGFNCLEPAKPLLGDSSVFTNTSPGVYDTHFTDLGRMKGLFR